MSTDPNQRHRENLPGGLAAEQLLCQEGAPWAMLPTSPWLHTLKRGPSLQLSGGQTSQVPPRRLLKSHPLLPQAALALSEPVPGAV